MHISEHVVWITVPRSAYTFKLFLSSQQPYQLVDFLQNICLSLCTVSGYIFFAGARQKVDNIHRAIFFAFQFLSVIRLFPSFDNLNSFAIIFSVHSRTMIARLPLSYPERSLRF